MSTTAAQRLRAGMCEDERLAKAADGPAWDDGWTDLPVEAYCHAQRYSPTRALADIAAKRQILALQAEFQVKRDQETAHPQYAVEMVCEVLDQVIAALAGVYQDTPAETAR